MVNISQKRLFIFLLLLLLLTANIPFLVNSSIYFSTFLNTFTLFISIFFIYHYFRNKESKFTQKLQNNETYKELTVAHNVQKALLDIDVPESTNLSIVKGWKSAKSLSGDFFTFIDKTDTTLKENSITPGVFEYKDSNDQYIGISIGDVAGHGVSSALVMALTSGLIGRIGMNNTSPAKTLHRLNNDVQRFISHSQITHVTTCYAVINTTTKELSYSNAGHLPILLMSSNESITELNAEGTFLGIYPNEQFEEKRHRLNKGDRLVFFTDGIIEQKNEKNDIFGLSNFKDLISKNMHLSNKDLLSTIFSSIESFSKNVDRKDDQTIVIVDIL
ncbi:hypothetical protein DID75_00815 [Candidatus Marinamargulisbacteria bacterium SCGC AG-410-N11]|nr:hypothetical protein DID75_00815 [Candidatus Marinamargulisbacteria bacterium SCGC AG-410-N11]